MPFITEPQFTHPSLPLSAPFLLTLCSHHTEPPTVSEPASAFCTCSSLYCSLHSYLLDWLPFILSGQFRGHFPQEGLPGPPGGIGCFLLRESLALDTGGPGLCPTVCSHFIHVFVTPFYSAALCKSTSYSVLGMSQVFRACEGQTSAPLTKLPSKQL